jgi:hypothetical protein
MALDLKDESLRRSLVEGFSKTRIYDSMRFAASDGSLNCAGIPSPPTPPEGGRFANRPFLGIDKSAMIRVRAGISYALTEAMDEGHCGLPSAELVPLAEKLLEVPVDLVRTAIDLEVADGTVIADTVAQTPCVFLAGLHRAERTIAERLLRFANGTLPWPWIDEAGGQQARDPALRARPALFCKIGARPRPRRANDSLAGRSSAPAGGPVRGCAARSVNVAWIKSLGVGVIRPCARQSLYSVS